MAALHHVGAVAPVPITPTRDNARRQPGVIEGNGKADDADSAARAAVSASDKAFSTLRAQLAMKAFELHVISDGAGGSMYLVQRLRQSRTLASLDEVRAFARQVGAAA